MIHWKRTRAQAPASFTPFISFLCCLQFLANLSVVQRWIILVVTAAVSPIGLAIGMGILESMEQNPAGLLLGQGIVFSMSAGSFLFIALLELLPSALSDGRLVHLKVAAFGIGYLAMAILGAYA